jgi:predicted DNA binding CopG/RHH family protein
MKKDNLKLDSQEKRIEKALKKGEFVKVSNLDESKKLFKEAAVNFKELNKTKRITIRVKNKDLIKVKARAKKNNIPYQTLLNALIRQFVQGKRVLKF